MSEVRRERQDASAQALSKSRDATPVNSDGESSNSIFVDAHEDRWVWRARIKRNPTTRRIYRFGVGFVGVFLILLAGATGWLPGPGGIPLALVGLAVLASEFDWAARLLDRVKSWLKRGAGWTARQPRWVRWLLVIGMVLLIALAVYASFLMFGVPGWFPDALTDALLVLPGVS
ncbi:MAG: PGPGW domain-containing protein [Actinomycetota bacterium]